MRARSRMAPLLVLLALTGGVLVARLYQIQVREHGTWAEEAARLVRKGHEEPYRRGRILDAAGRVLAVDEELRAVELVYRDFRREHPLGNVAHARSLVDGRPVSLQEARAHLVEWALELVALSPADLRAWARGTDPRRTVQAAETRLRARRAGDLAFYLPRLLAFEPEARAEWRALHALVKGEDERRSYLALAAAVRHGEAGDGPAREEAALRARLAHSLERLATLARWIRPAGDDGREPLSHLLDELETTRRSVEDAAAAKLFAEAVGFVPGRLEPDTLLACFDHRWITDLLGWDGARLAQWAATVRAGWQQGWRDGECLPQLFTALATDPEAEPGVGDFLARLAVVYQPEGELARALAEGPRPWREVEELAVFSGLEDLFVADVPRAAHTLAARALPIQLEELRALPGDARLLPAGAGPDSFRGLLAECLGKRRLDVAGLVELARALNEIWELRYQETVREALDLVRRAAERDELGEGGGLLVAAAGRERAAERAEYFLKDFGTRPTTLSLEGTGVEVPYDVVYLLTRYERDYPGFGVRTQRARARPELVGDDVRPAERLVGLVSLPTLEDRLRQRREEARLRELKADPDPEEEEAEELRRLIGVVRGVSEARGVSGLEAFLDRELRGTNGFAMTRGAAEIFGAGGDELSVRAAEDGEDVELTLDAGLQAAVQRCLRDPAPEHEDGAWRASPVGAVVLLAANGDVLAAASEPDDESVIDPEAAGQRALRMERTLRKPTFQPPGSVLKPLVSALALEHGLDPARTVVCAPLERGGAGYADLRCSSLVGHGAVDLHAALVQSCNAYFAWLGETMETREFAELGTLFGLGAPTGVRGAPWDDGDVRRPGLLEDRGGFALPASGAALNASLRRRAANGLAVVEATPMQIARAMLALASGAQRELRLVRRIGARELAPAPSTPLPIARAHLARVHAALRGVAAEGRGTAHAALAPSVLGLRVAAKTGSADLETAGEDLAKVRKHAWVAGWVPAEAPELVFVVFEHDTIATSSHGAIYLARDVLRQPEVRAWLAAREVELEEPR
ncbi:MAG TPA: penicillin-binding transpeptidase domain-containing protein [Planctomycetota bacterium]